MKAFCFGSTTIFGFIFSLTVSAGEPVAVNAISSDELLYLHSVESFGFKEGFGVKIFKLKVPTECDFENTHPECMKAYEYLMFYKVVEDNFDFVAKRQLYKTGYAFERRFSRAFKDKNGRYCVGYGERVPVQSSEMLSQAISDGVKVESEGWVFMDKSICFDQRDLAR